MRLILSELNEALLAAGAPPEKAKAAAESVADFKEEISEVKNGIAELKGSIKLVQWMLALVIVIDVLPYLKSLAA